MMVVITEKRDKSWYSAREPDNFDSEGVLPCHFVHIVKFVFDCCLSDLLALISGHIDT